MIHVIYLGFACTGIGLALLVGWWLRGKRAVVDDARHAYVMCSLFLAIRKGLDEQKYDDVRQTLTSSARAQFQIWTRLNATAMERCKALDQLHEAAIAEFAAGHTA